MKRFFSTKLATLALVLLGGTVQASPVPATALEWTYNFSPGAPSVVSDGNPSSYVQFSNQPTKTAVGKSVIVATNLKAFSAAPAATPDVLSTNGAYSLTLVLSETEDGTTYMATKTFTGKLSGTFSAQSANVDNMFGPNATQTVSLGSYTFTVSLNSYTPFGPPDQDNLGSISALVKVSSATSSGGDPDSPEPSTMLLSGLGLTFLGGAAWRKRRKAQAEPV